MDISKMISLKIKKICKERNISINRLAKICNITQSTLQSLVARKSKNPKLQTINKICKGINISLADFFNDDIFTYKK